MADAFAYSIHAWTRHHYQISKRRRIERRKKIFAISILVLAILALLTFHAIKFMQSKPDRQYLQVLQNCSDRNIAQVAKSNHSDAYKARYADKCYNDRLAQNLWQK